MEFRKSIGRLPGPNKPSELPKMREKIRRLGTTHHREGSRFIGWLDLLAVQQAAPENDPAHRRQIQEVLEDVLSAETEIPRLGQHLGRFAGAACCRAVDLAALQSGSPPVRFAGWLPQT